MRGIPGGFQFHQPQTNWRVPEGIDFRSAVALIIAHRKGNKWITQQHNLSTDERQVADELDEFNAARMLSHPGWERFVGDTSAPKTWSPSTSLRRLASGVAGASSAVRRTAAGVKLVAEWLGAGLRPVDHALAEKRAAVCVGCPMNGDPNWLQRLDAAVADQIKTLVEVKNDLKLSTTSDEKLLTCKACDCFLKLKVHAPIEHIKANTSATVKANLWAKCWILSE